MQTILISIIALSLLLCATALIIKTLQKKEEPSRDALVSEIERMKEEIKEYHNSQISMLRTGYAEQRAEMKMDFDARIQLIENSSDKKLQELRAFYETQTAILAKQQEKQIEIIRENAANEYQSISRQILDTNTEALKRQNNEQMDSILSPIKEKLDKFNSLVIDTYAKENASRKSLTDQISMLMELNRHIGEEAKNLTNALKSDSKTQGDWGETLLTTLLEQAGLVEGIHFDTQVTRDKEGNVLRGDDGKGKRPDVVLHLPDKKELIIDSKVSLTAFVNYSSCEDESMRTKLGKNHVDSIKKHIDELFSADYQKVINNSAEYVLMFVPVENAYLLASQLDRNLWKYAYDRHVAIVSPTHIFSVMQIISQIWTQDSQNRNVMKIAEAGGKLYDKLSRFCEEFEKVDKGLSAAHNAYDSAYKHLTKGRGNIISRAETLKNLGAKASRAIPASVISNTDIEENESPEYTDRIIGNFNTGTSEPQKAVRN